MRFLFFFCTGEATVDEPGSAEELFADGGGGPFRTGSVLTGLFGPSFVSARCQVFGGGG